MSKAVTKLLHNDTKDNTALSRTLEAPHMPTSPRLQYEDYPHKLEQSPLDDDISETKIRVALTNLTKSTAPGKEGVSYRTLKYLDDGTVTALTAYYNETWRTGILSMFDVAMAGLTSLLSKIPDVQHAPYADDITVWLTKGSTDQIQNSLQEVVEITKPYATEASITCGAQKSELLVIRPRARSVKCEPEVDLHLDGTPIPR
ncbi:hypothetical protein HPB47_013566, partial [Ixodes persulcatus]